MATREGKWKCPACSTVNLGRHTACQGCSRVRDANVRFFLDDDAAEVSDEKLAKLAASGADWSCLFCSTENRASETHCRQCGAERGSSPARAEKLVTGASGAAPEPPSGPAPAAMPARRPLPLPALLGGGGAALAVIAGLIWFLFIRTDAVALAVESAAWERSIVAEAGRLVIETNWREQVPAGARELRSWQEKAGTEQVQTGTQRVKTGTRDKGNGFFEDVYETRPVYESRDVIKTKVEYEVMRWLPVRTERSSGAPPKAPSWPELRLAAGEREGPRKESATVVFSYSRDGKEHRKEHKPPVGEILDYTPGRRFSAKMTVTGIIQELTPVP